MFFINLCHCVIVVINQDRFRTAACREFRPDEIVKPECLLLKLQHKCSRRLNEARRDRSNINVKGIALID